MVFFTALVAVALLLAAAIPGYLMIKKKMVSEACIPGFSKVLLYVSQPCLAVYTFKSSAYSLEKLIDVGKFALLSAAIFAIMIGSAYLLLRHRYEKSIYRVMTFAVGSANCAFFGIPIIEALMPEIAADVIIFTMVYSLVMNLIGWTVGSAIMTRNIKYVSLKKMVVNPAFIGTAVALLLFITELPIPVFGATPDMADHIERMVETVVNIITVTAKMSTPVSMLVMGMRLATMDFRKMFVNVRVYITIFAKQIIMPLASFLLVVFLPISSDLKCTFFIICACPVASVTLNYAEIVGEGQEEAASMLLVGTMLSILTLPLMVLFLPLLA